MSSRFAEVSTGPPIEVFALNKAFLDDTNPNKVNLGVGAYRTDDGKPWVLPVVRRTEQAMAANEVMNHEYLPVLGLDSFSSAATRMLLGKDNKAIAEGRAFGIQTLSGTGSLRIAAEFLGRILKYKTFYYSVPTWENHNLIFANAGFTEAKAYRYWKPETRGLDFEGMLEDLKNAPENAVIILHACAHNPTGVDPTHDQWKQIANVCQEKKLFPLFDCAYQGFASGNLEKDSHAVCYFLERGFELMACQSFAKNFGLYNERAGNLSVVLNDVKLVAPSKSQFTLLVRGMYSNPPNHGASIVSTVLNTPELCEEWKGCIETMANRIISMRNGLKERLVKLGTPGNWDHITQQIGMFSYTGLNLKHVEILVEKFHIYLLKSGRINMCGLTSKNLDYVAQSIHDTVTSVGLESNL